LSIARRGGIIVSPMSRKLFLPSNTALTALAAIVACAVGCALYMRYFGVQQTSVGLACEAGLNSWFCMIRKLTIALYEHSIFGVVALGLALINLLRPSVALLAFALIFAGLGIVLYNVALCGLAAAILILSFARPAPASE
jgi:hypothetical protein